jgi:hypothetical protein
VCRSATANHLCEELRPTMHSDTTTGLSYRMVSYWRPTPYLANYHFQLRRYNNYLATTTPTPTTPTPTPTPYYYYYYTTLSLRRERLLTW